MSGRLAAIALPARLTHVAPLIAVLGLFAACAFVIPTLAPVATTDDWGYSRSVEIFRDTGRLEVLPAVAATAIFQISWGILFSSLFGMSLGLMRVSTLVMTAIGAAGTWWLCRELGVSRSRSSLGTAAYLFNPLSFILSYTFMTDAHLTALVMVSTALYVRGLRGDGWASVAGSVVASCAFLTRQQGILVPAAVVLFLMLAGAIRWNRSSLVKLLRVAAVPAVVVAAYAVWTLKFGGATDIQEGFFHQARRAGAPGAWTLMRHLTFIEIMYAGFFCLPLTIAAAPLIGRIRFDSRWWGKWLIGGVLISFLLGFASFSGAGRHMPYVPQFVGPGGLGSPDVRGSRPRLVEQPWFDVATIVCAVSTVVLLVVIGRAAASRIRPDSGKAGLVAVIAMVQVFGILPPSFHYLRRGYSLDRYLLPLLPLSIALLLWALRDLPLKQWLGWTVVAVFAVANVAATRDYLVYIETVWTIADQAVEAGARPDQVDAGAAWDGYQLYTYGLDNDIIRARTRGGPWWLTFYGLASDSTYVVSSKPVKGYVQVATFTYDTWLPDATRTMYLLRRFGAPGLPELSGDSQ